MFSPRDRFRSNNGKGPLLARILYVEGDEVHMERWPECGGKRVQFALPLPFLTSQNCGWAKIQPAQ